MQNENSINTGLIELIGRCPAYLDTGEGPKGTLVDYKILFEPVGQLRDIYPPEIKPNSIDDFDVVILVSPKVTKKYAIKAIEEILQMVKTEGLFVGEHQTYDSNNPFRLFDQGPRIIGKQDF